MKYVAGDAEHHTGLLLGFESDAYHTTNQLGHTHGLGNPEFASSFGGQRVDEIGDKYGGRELDLCGLDPTLLSKILDGCTTYFNDLCAQRDHTTSGEDTERTYGDVQSEMSRWAGKLCGRKMSDDDFETFLNDMGIQLSAQEKAAIRNGRA